MLSYIDEIKVVHSLKIVHNNTILFIC